MILTRWARLALGGLAMCACGDSATGSASDTVGDTGSSGPSALGGECRSAADCIDGVCMKSEYGTPFCTRACDRLWEPCDAGPDATGGDALCIGFDDLPNPATGPFVGDLSQFCAPRCSDVRECAGLNPGWEECDVPKYLGDPLFPQLGNIRVCAAPSYQGKEPVDPQTCDWEKTTGRYANEANLCRSYCEYLDRCKERTGTAAARCCEWGCFNQIIIEDSVNDAWSDEIRCFIDNHAAFPETGPLNACTEPPKNCGVPGSPPVDPTPPAAGG